MKLLALLALTAGLAACSHAPRPIMLDDERRTPKTSEADVERKAREALRNIQDRIARGDLPKIEFEFDKDEITPESHETLDLIAQLIMSDDHLKLLIRAHTDNVGTDEYNLDLAQRRAKAVSDYLSTKGVRPPSMRYRGFGASKPIADNATEGGRAKNRRVEFYVTTRHWDSVY